MNKYLVDPQACVSADISFGEYDRDAVVYNAMQSMGSSIRGSDTTGNHYTMFATWMLQICQTLNKF